MTDKYDKHRDQLDLEEWAMLLEDREYCRVARFTILGILFSTVWVGLNHRFGDDGPPLIFESMAFKNYNPDKPNEAESIYQNRYSTLTGARFGHLGMVWRVLWDKKIKPFLNI